MVLIIALFINGSLIPQQSYPVTGNCEEISQHPAVILSWEEVYRGEKVVFYCAGEEKQQKSSQKDEG